MQRKIHMRLKLGQELKNSLFVQNSKVTKRNFSLGCYVLTHRFMIDSRRIAVTVKGAQFFVSGKLHVQWFLQSMN